MANKVKKKNYFQISGWMLELADKYELKDKELLVYAIIYGFSQDGKSWFSGSLDYISQWIRTDRQNVYSRYLKPLLDKGLIKREKIDLTLDTSSFKYMAIVPNDISLIDEDDKCSQNETSTHNCEGCSQNETSALNLSEQRSQNETKGALNLRHNNIYNTNKDNIYVVKQKPVKYDFEIREKAATYFDETILSSERYKAFQEADDTLTINKATLSLIKLLKEQNTSKVEKSLKLSQKQIIDLVNDVMNVQLNMYNSFDNPDGYIVSRLNKALEKV